MASIVINKNGSQGSVGLQTYTPQQMTAVCNSWAAFERSQNRIAENIGGDMIFGGNALPVPKDAWGQWAQTGIELQRSMLGVFADLASTNSRGVDMSLLVDHFATFSDTDAAVEVSLDGREGGKGDSPAVKYHGTPLAVYRNHVRFGWKQMAQLMSSGSAGSAMQNSAMLSKYRKMLEVLESMVVNGRSDVKVGGDEAYGLLNHPNRNSRSTGVTLNGATPTQIKAEVVATLKLAHADNFKTGFTLYLNWDDYFYMSSYENTVATGTPTATGDSRRTIERELLNIPGVDRIVATDSVPANTIIALVKDRTVVEVLSGMPITQRAKTRLNPEDDYVFENIAIQALQLKFDDAGKMGLAVSQ